MLIDLNGMLFHLNLQNPDDQDGYKAEIVDEAFNFGVQRAQVDDLDGVAAFVQSYAGIAPRTDVLSQIARRLEDLYRADGVASASVVTSAENTGIAAAG